MVVAALINRRSCIKLPLQDGETPPPMGTLQPAFTQGSSHAGQTEPRTGHVVPGQCISRRIETTPSRGSDDLVGL